MLRNLVVTVFIASVSYSYAFASNNEDQIASDCEYSVPDDLIVGSKEYWDAVDECITEKTANMAKAEEE